MMEFNFLSQENAIVRESASGRYAVDQTRIPAAIAKLAKELLEIEAAGDQARATGTGSKNTAQCRPR